MNKFLTARWEDLVMANYEVDPQILRSRLPQMTEIDLDGGKCFVSLVAFMFLDTRVKGFPVPFHINFEEVNLRFYVKHQADDEVRRGVCFVKEIVPKTAIAAVARLGYGEPYEKWKMGNYRDNERVEYSFAKGGVENLMSVSRGRGLGVPPAGSHGEFIIEHYWGYTKRSSQRTDEYKVEHPKWELFDVCEPRINVDFGATYGPEFAFLTKQAPSSILLAQGSEVSVFKGRRLAEN